MGYLEKAREHINRSNLEKEKLILINNLFQDLNENCPRGIYKLLEEQYPHLIERFNNAEDKINTLFKKGTIIELKQALEEFWFLHIDIVGRIVNKTRKVEIF